jgi:hypothetical protein
LKINPLLHGLNGDNNMNTTSEVIYDTDMGCHKIVVPVNRPDGNSINVTFPIFVDRDIPEDQVFYDYYESGALYINIPSGSHISSYKNTFVTILSKYIYGDPSFSNLDNFNDAQSIQSFDDKYGWTKFFLHPHNPQKFGFIFFIDLIFETKKINISHPICKNFTLSEKDKPHLSVVSSKYFFANMVHDSTICSHDSIAINDSFANCPFGIENQNTCSFYEPSQNLIKAAKSYNSTTGNLDSHISLIHFRSYTHNVFVITNNVSDLEITKLSFPISSEHSLEDLIQEAISVFNTVINTYPNMELSSIEDNYSEPLLTASYISHLIGDSV